MPAQVTPGQAVWQQNSPAAASGAPYNSAPYGAAPGGASVWATNPAVRPGTSVTGMAPPVGALPVNTRPGGAEVFADPLNPLNPGAGLMTPLTGEPHMPIDVIVNETRT